MSGEAYVWLTVRCVVSRVRLVSVCGGLQRTASRLLWSVQHGMSQPCMLERRWRVVGQHQSRRPRDLYARDRVNVM